MVRAFSSKLSKRKTESLLKKANKLQKHLDKNFIELKKALDLVAERQAEKTKKENEFVSRVSEEMKPYAENPLIDSFLEDSRDSIPVFPNAAEELKVTFDLTENDDIRVPTWEESQEKLMGYMEENFDNENFQPE